MLTIKGDEAVQKCLEYLDKFIDIYPKDENWENKMPEGVKLTVYCKGTSEEGFIINATTYELGLEQLIARKWILHSELEKLVCCKIE